MVPSEHKIKWKQFLRFGERVSFKRQETIINVDASPGSAFYWIASGYVKVCSYTKAGNERIHYIYGPKDLFPVGWLYGRLQQSVTFIALTNVTLVKKSDKEFTEYIHREPFILSEIIRMQFNVHDRIYNLNLDNPKERVAHCMLTFAERFGEKKGEFVAINIPLTQEEFADTVRLSRETAGKILNEFEDHGEIILGRRRILVDVDKLEKSIDG